MGRPKDPNSRTEYVAVRLDEDEKEGLERLLLSEIKRTGYKLTLSDIIRQAIQQMMKKH